MEDLRLLTINFALFASTDHSSQTSRSPNISAPRSSRSFERSDAVGLGIVAAMNDVVDDVRASVVFSSVAVPKASVGSKSIPIGGGGRGELRFGFGGGGGLEEEEDGDDEVAMEMSESYTCVVSQIGNDRVSKKEYFEDRVVRKGVFSTSFVEAIVPEEQTQFWRGGLDFLSSCNLCGKSLHGIDIFMYRGDKAFCSAECRDMQIAMDKRKEKRGRVVVRSIELSESPCCSPMLSYTGVVAA